MLHADRFRHALFPRQLLHAIPFPPSLLVTGHLYGADGTWCRRSLAKPRRSAPQRRLLRFFWREVRLRVDGRFLSSRRPVPASRRKCSRSRVRGCLAVSRCGSGAAGGKILKPILAISVSFYFRLSEVRDRRSPLPRFLLSAPANLRLRVLFPLPPPRGLLLGGPSGVRRVRVWP